MKRSNFWKLSAWVAAFLIALASPLVFASFAVAQSSGLGQVTGTIVDAQRRPVRDADVRLTGPVSKVTESGADGSFTFVNLPAASYRLEITKAGFNAASQGDVLVTTGSTINLSFSLQAASLTSLAVIGSVSVSSRNGANAINTTPASIVDVPATTFSDQGQLSVNKVLNEEPGVTIGIASSDIVSDGASPLATGVPSVRGGLPYETESLIDGHAISLGQSGLYSPSFLSPYLLQDVEVVKGPGATSPSINYAINGTINYRTLEPTLKTQESADFGEDQYGGNFANFRLTGTLPDHRLSYAFDYVTQGTQGFARGFNPPSIYFPLSQAYLNGTAISALGGFSAVTNVTPPNEPANVYGNYISADTFLICCPNQPMSSNQRNELAKVRYSFNPSTTLTLTWLGGQTNGTLAGTRYSCFNLAFAPPAGYAGSLTPGPTTGFISGFDTGYLDRVETNLFESEFHTPIGKTATLQLREYSSSIQTFYGGPGDSGPTQGGITSITAAIYGGVYYNGASTPTLFNGQTGTLTVDQYYENRSYNDLNGYTAEIDKQAGEDLLSLSYDYEKTSTLATVNCAGTLAVNIPGGSSQTFESVMGRAQMEFGDRLTGSLSDNFGSYTDVYSQNAGATFLSATHTYQAPRLSLTWRPNGSQSVRFAAGFSVAPPYIALLNNSQSIVANGSVGLPYFTESGNSGDVLPETAFGADLGFDTRLHSPYTVLSIDLYQTVLRDQFLQSTTQDGTFTCNDPKSYNYGLSGPLYVTKTANLGHSEYEGVEISLHRTPPVGWGYRAQGSLLRAFAYDLPMGFYNTASCTDCTNLGILPNINFQANGFAFNAMSSAPVPYSMGYGEINYRARNGAYFLAGVTYYGPNNSYDQPAFEVLTTTFEQPISRKASLQLSIYNVTNTYPGFFTSYNHSKYYPVLENGALGGQATNVLGPSNAQLTLHIELQ